MGKRNIRVEFRMSQFEWDALEAAAERTGRPARRYAREATIAVSSGRILPAEWVGEIVELLDEARAKAVGVAGYMPEGWGEDLEQWMGEVIEFDASRTLFRSALVDSLNKARAARSPAPVIAGERPGDAADEGE